MLISISGLRKIYQMGEVEVRALDGVDLGRPRQDDQSISLLENRVAPRNCHSSTSTHSTHHRALRGGKL